MARATFFMHARLFSLADRLVLALSLALLAVLPLPAQEVPSPNVDDGPPISITSPDPASTFVYGSIKDHSLIWNKKDKVLIAHVTFLDTEENSGSANEDSHEFRLPGVTLDEAKGIFYATSPKGEVIPVAHFKKTLFIKSIEVTPNARVRIQRIKGEVAVILEALRPDDPALKAPPGDTRQVKFENLIQ